jgi:histidinol-phosphate aminotransferase
VDEAYFEFHGKTVIGEIGSLENLFVARTFSKAYGLAGLRVGVLAGPQRQMPMVRRVSSPYNVNAAALFVLPAVLADHDHISHYVSEVIRARERLAGELTALGLYSWPSQANFVLVKIGERHLEFVQAMRGHGILVRDRHDDPGCDGCVRITLGNESQTSQLIAALRHVVSGLNIVNEVRA